MNIKQIKIMILVMASMISLGGCSKEQSSNPSSKTHSLTNKQEFSTNPKEPIVEVKAISQSVSQGLGTVTRLGEGTKGSPIIVLEETHTSLSGQLEQAIVLVRLYEQFGLRDIALEGYLKERPPITTEWFSKAGRGLTVIERSSVAAQMLSEGEISAAEFMKLTYDDIILHPIETLAEHAVELNKEASTITLTYLIKIAQNSLQESHVPKMKELEREIQNASGNGKMLKINELLDFIMSVDAWTKSKYSELKDTNRLKSITAEKFLADVEEIDRRARSANVQLEKEEMKAMEENLKFWRGRKDASRTMIAETCRIADRPGVKLIALNIGAAHTDGMVAMLSNDKRAFAVIQTMALSGDRSTTRGEIETLNRKYKGLSIFNEGITKELLEAFPILNQKKPEPVLNQPWLQAKAEMHLFITRITRRVIPSPANGGAPPFTPRPPTGSPPFGFGDDDFKGKWIYINPKMISAVPNENAVMFPMVLNPEDPSRKKEMWVKAGFSPAFTVPVTSAERRAVEEILKKHLDAVRVDEKAKKAQDANSDLQNPNKEISRKAEDAKGRIQIDKDIVATIKTSKSEAVAAPIDSI